MRVPVRIALGAIAVGAAAVAIAFLTRGGGEPRPVRASGTVETTEADLGFQIPGRIDRILVQEGDTVSAGTELARLDQTELRAGLDAARAQAGAARARLRELQSGFRVEEIDQARASLRAVRQQLADAEREAGRSRRLFEGGAISQRARDAAQVAFDVAEAQEAAARDHLALLEAGPRTEQIAAQRALVAQSAAAVAQVEAMLDQATIRAPAAGRITIRHREPGESVAAGMPVLTLTDPTTRWIRIYVRGDDVGRLALGEAVTIRADAYRDRTYGGEITFIASEAEFTPRNVQTTEERVRLVYRVKVRILDDPAHDLKPGLPADVLIEDARP